MKATFSVLVSELSGKAGDVVAARWKGRPYFRRRVTPANPNSTAQQEVRTALALCTGSWKSLVAKVKTAWASTGASLGISAFNAFTKANAADERTSNWQHYTSPDLTRAAVATVTANTGVAAGGITVTWTAGSADTTDIMHIAVRLPDDPAVAVVLDATTTVAALTYEVTGLTPATLYNVYVTNRSDADEFASSAYTTATSHA